MKMYRMTQRVNRKNITVRYLDKDDAEWAAKLFNTSYEEEEVDIYDFCELCGVAANGRETWYGIDDAMVQVREIFTEYGTTATIRSGETLANQMGWL